MIASTQNWPSLQAILRMDHLERGLLLDQLESRLKEILSFFDDPDNHSSSLAWKEQAVEEIEITDTIELIFALGYRHYGEPA